MPDEKQAKDASEYGSFKPRKAREVQDQRLILNHFEFYDGFYGESYRMTVLVENTGEIMRLTGHHTHVLDWLKAIPGPEECPIKFKFSKAGNAFIIEGWGEGLTPHGDADDER